MKEGGLENYISAERTTGRPDYVDADPMALTPELIDSPEARRAKTAELKAHALLTKYQKEEWDRGALEYPTAEERASVFTEAVLSRLDTDTYLRLWSHGSPHYLSHVTRHGFRDHAAMIYHTGGLDEFGDAAHALLTDSRQLRSPFGSTGMKGSNDERIKQVLHQEVAADSDNHDEIRRRADNYFDFTLAAASKYPDKTAIHLAAETVLDSHYGGETGNEVFVIFPADFIASQYPYYFNGWGKDFTQPQSEDKWNDVMAWPKKIGAGISLDAGLVFLPKSVAVDPNTGSSYQSAAENGERSRVIDENLLAEMIDQFSHQPFVEVEADALYTERDTKIIERIKELLASFGRPVTDSALHDLSRLITYPPEDSAVLYADLKTLLIRENLVYKMSADDPSSITAEEFWENYFTQYPNRRPRHVVYYDGDPSRAVDQFLSANDIRKDRSRCEALLGFEANHVTEPASDSRANPDRAKMDRILEEMMDEILSGDT